MTAVGTVAERGSRELDAEGKVVIPGFIDIHTHLDAQISWDPLGSSSCWHGVTSVVLGNCGVTFAPCAPDEREYLAEMMESVEDIPRDSILEGERSHTAPLIQDDAERGSWLAGRRRPPSDPVRFMSCSVTRGWTSAAARSVD